MRDDLGKDYGSDIRVSRARKSNSTAATLTMMLAIEKAIRTVSLVMPATAGNVPMRMARGTSVEPFHNRVVRFSRGCRKWNAIISARDKAASPKASKSNLWAVTTVCVRRALA